MIGKISGKIGGKLVENLLGKLAYFFNKWNISMEISV